MLVVALGFEHSQTQDIGTHSCKATCLSWMSKAGIDVASRRLLGYHVDPSTKTCLVCSRDAASGPLRELDKVFGWIRNLQFDPDSARSGYFNVPVGAAGPETVDVEESMSASDTEDSADEEPSEEQHKEMERATDEVVGEWNEHSTVESLQLEAEPTLFQNRNARYYHVCADVAEKFQPVTIGSRTSQGSFRLNAAFASNNKKGVACHWCCRCDTWMRGLLLSC